MLAKDRPPLISPLLGQFIFSIPAYDSLVSKVVPENMRGIAFGLFHTSLGILSLPAPWIGARLWEVFYPAAPFYITAAAVLLAVVIAWLKLRPPDNKKPVGVTGFIEFSAA